MHKSTIYEIQVKNMNHDYRQVYSKFNEMTDKNCLLDFLSKKIFKSRPDERPRSLIFVFLLTKSYFCFLVSAIFLENYVIRERVHLFDSA